MSTPAIMTLTKMMETLPVSVQEQAVEHLRDYLAELQDENQWDALYDKTQHQLVETAKRARQEIAEGKAKPMDFKRL
jgi:hypothetical protein